MNKGPLAANSLRFEQIACSGPCAAKTPTVWTYTVRTVWTVFFPYEVNLRPMRSPLVPQAQLHNVVSFYLSVLDAEAEGCDPRERQLTIDLVRRWVPGTSTAEVGAMVDTASHAARSGVHLDAEAVAAALCEALPLAGRRRLLSDLGLLARADGHLMQRKAEAIATARSLLLPRPVVH